MRDFRFAQKTLWRQEGRRRVYKNDLAQLRNAIVSRLQYDTGGIIYDSRRANYKYQVLLTKYVDGYGHTIEGKDVYMSGIQATSDTNALIRRIEQWFREIQDPRETAVYSFGSDEASLNPDTILSGEFTIRRIRLATASGGGRTPIQFGAFTSFVSNLDGKRTLFGNYYTCEDNVSYSNSNNCIFYCIRRALNIHHSKIPMPRICRHQADIPQDEPININKLPAICAILGNPPANIIVITDTPRVDGTVVSDNVIFTHCTDATLEPKYIVYSADVGHYTFLVRRTEIPTILGGVLRQGQVHVPKAIKLYKTRKVSEDRLPTMQFVFDYETVRDTKGEILPYSGAWNTQSLEDGVISDEEYVNMTTTKSQEPGSEITDAFVKYLKRHAKYYETKFAVAVGFNNSRFDNFILLKHLYSHEDIASTLEVFIAKTSILTMTFTVHGMKVMVTDLCRIVNTSLKKASQAFQLKKLKGEQDHKLIQHIYEEGKLLDHLRTNYAKLEEYNKCDVEVTGLLAWAVRNALTKILDLAPGYTSETALTIASLAAKTWKHKLKMQLHNQASLKLATTVGLEGDISRYQYEKLVKSKIGVSQTKHILQTVKGQLPHAPQSRPLHDFVKKSLIGGRAQAFKVGMYQGRYTVLDVVSLYPAMMSLYMPVGELVPATASDFSFRYNRDTGFYHHGIWDVSISFQKEWVPNVIPLRSDHAPLNWSYKGPMRVVLSTVDIISLHRYHGDCYDVHGGWRWADSSNSVFSCYMSPVKKAKIDEDAKKARGEKHNAAEREMAKMLMNSVSGKVGQNIVSEIKRILTNTPDGQEEFTNLLNAEKKGEFKNGLKIIKITPDIIYVHGTYNDETMETKYDPEKASPKQLAGLIYALSRDHMMRVISECPSIIGMDTDSAFISMEDYENLLAKQPRLFGSEFGQLVEEMTEMYQKVGLVYNRDTSQQKFYMLAPKCYMIIDLETNTPLKIRFKGVSPNAKLITRKILEERFAVDEHEEILAMFGISTKLDRIDANTDSILDKLPPALCEDLYKAMLAEEEIWVVQSQIAKKVDMSELRQVSTHKRMRLRRDL